MDEWKIVFIGVPKQEKEKREVWELLLKCDQDFVPPLSQRKSSAQKMWNEQSMNHGEEGPKAYFNEMILQQFVFLRINQKLVGFMTFKNKENSVEVPHPLVTNYITTLCIDPAYRGRHLAERLYSYIEHKLPKEVAAPCLTLRTWSTNDAQLHLLEKRGYICYKRLLNDRKEGIDTLYFYKIIDRSAD